MKNRKILKKMHSNFIKTNKNIYIQSNINKNILLNKNARNIFSFRQVNLLKIFALSLFKIKDIF